MANNWNLCGACDNSGISKPSEKSGVPNVMMGYVEIVESVTVLLKQQETMTSKHDCPCCKKCVKFHTDCKGLTDINDIIKNVKTSNACYEIEQTLIEVVENINIIIANRKENQALIKEKKRRIEEVIKQTRTKINNHLDKLQEDMTKELVVTEQKESRKIKKLLIALKKKEKKITEFQANLAYIKQHACELESYLAMKHIEKDIAVKEKYIQSIVDTDTIKHVDISCQISKSLQQITASVQQFGEIHVSFGFCHLSIQKRKQKQAQFTAALPTSNMDTLTPTLNKCIDNWLSNVRGCFLLHGGRMVFSSFQPSLIRVCKSDGSEDFKIIKIGDTFDVVSIGDDFIAVSSGCRGKINIIDTNNKKLKKTIYMESFNGGIAFKDGNLIYCAGPEGLRMINLRDESNKPIANNKLSEFAYVTTFADKLFYTNNETDSVTCCDYHGNILWTFCDASVLKFPIGISVDNDGYVFVVGYHTCNVVVISPDGKRSRQLLSSKDGLEYPRVLHYDTSTNKLLVANRKFKAILFDVK
ncbi:unnamed protein product [Mytilus edulis]|uniref:Uncharacterized protein n=1 Tax=Mytilus edulis TaxID=6550 RepID=A0A8S3USP1_MYTED|nr:unnamed protein product [Mytilus edulis]